MSGDKPKKNAAALPNDASAVAGLMRAGGPGGGANPFDMSGFSNLLQDPSIRLMAEQIAHDPNFAQMAQAMQAQMLEGGMPGRAPGGAARGPPAVDPAQYMQAMQGMMQNPEFMQMAERLGTQMMQDPSVAGMMSQMQNPQAAELMKAKMEELKKDPEIGNIMAEIESGGPAAMMKYWNDPKVLQKLGAAMGGEGFPGMMPAGGAGAVLTEAEGEEEEEEGGEEEETLHSAASEGDHERVKELLKEGADVNAKDEEGRTALHFACGYGETAVVDVLINNKADLDATDSNLNTALHYAAGYGKEEMVTILVEAGASVVLKNQDGKTPMDVAKLNKQDAVLKVLEGTAFL